MAYQISTQKALGNAGYNEIYDLMYCSIVPACCSDGCDVEPDGSCEHGYPSVLIDQGLI